MIVGRMVDTHKDRERIRLGAAAEMLGVSPDTVRRWTESGVLPAERTAGGQRTVARADVTHLAAERRRAGRVRPIVAQSARNRFPGVVTEVRADSAAAVVEVVAGIHRLVSLITRESVDELGLVPGKEVICVVKATDVMIEVPS
jgi:molybdopterin-binding protein